jgi:hypothetical protein
MHMEGVGVASGTRLARPYALYMEKGDWGVEVSLCCSTLNWSMRRQCSSPECRLSRYAPEPLRQVETRRPRFLQLQSFPERFHDGFP